MGYLVLVLVFVRRPWVLVLVFVHILLKNMFNGTYLCGWTCEVKLPIQVVWHLVRFCNQLNSIRPADLLLLRSFNFLHCTFKSIRILHLDPRNCGIKNRSLFVTWICIIQKICKKVHKSLNLLPCLQWNRYRSPRLYWLHIFCFLLYIIPE